jgi:hypothetical protein
VGACNSSSNRQFATDWPPAREKKVYIGAHKSQYPSDQLTQLCLCAARPLDPLRLLLLAASPPCTGLGVLTVPFLIMSTAIFSPSCVFPALRRLAPVYHPDFVMPCRPALFHRPRGVDGVHWGTQGPHKQDTPAADHQGGKQAAQYSFLFSFFLSVVLHSDTVG